MPFRFSNLWRPTVLPNLDSTARDHLANERTFLAWARTGLGFVGLGVALEKFAHLGVALENFAHLSAESAISAASAASSSSNTASDTLPAPPPLPPLVKQQDGRVAAITFVGLGGAVLAHGTIRYYSTMQRLMNKQFAPSTGGVALLVLVSSGLTLGGLYSVLMTPGHFSLHAVEREHGKVGH
ncbi:hypothetical protein HK097_010506 [Rhizophlyctis rosea]|uniref:DUF202 domain-containing protein n=1 Tax=Rhizophlyctis rosea TaxID=64517 RepID=A0AAD5S9T6_9FUNG|nr:hypothetical protein HK097_010506 [Rhizophlyctis rosea]